MSEERFDRLEAQLSQVIQGMDTMQQNMAVMEQNMAVMQQNISGINSRIDGLQNRIDSVEGTVIAAITGGFDYVRREINDLNINLNENELSTEANARKSRRINQRLTALEHRVYGDRDED
jgi:chromosome segregation ATPase